MVQFPNCKLNLGLAVTEKRADGFHNLETVFIPLNLCDALEFIESDTLQLTLSGNPIPGKIEDNLLLKAYYLLKADFPFLPNLHINLLKKIPTGGGLGGGSSDASFLLKMLNEYFDLKIQQNKLIQYALNLGSDCPFFILNSPCHALGRGEILQPIKLDLSSYTFIIVMPGIHVSTADAFKSLVPNFPSKPILQIIQQPISTWKHELKNDFEFPIFNSYPQLHEIKNEMYHVGCDYAAMSGSGSTMFGMIKDSNLDQIKSNIHNSNILKRYELFFCTSPHV